MYKGIFYVASWYSPDRENDNRDIHQSLLPAVLEFMNRTDFNEIVQKNRISNYLDKALLFAGHVDDLYEVIPAQYHHLLARVSAELYNIREPASEDQINQFKEKNISGRIEFNKLFLEDLLMA